MCACTSRCVAVFCVMCVHCACVSPKSCRRLSRNKALSTHNKTCRGDLMFEEIEVMVTVIARVEGFVAGEPIDGKSEGM